MELDFGDIATFPTEGDDWIVTVLIGGVLALFAFLIVPVLFVWGYVIELMRGAVEGAEQPPEFDDWGDLAADGLKGLAVLIAYQIVPLVFLLVVAGGSFLALLTGTEAGAGLGLLGFVGGMFVYAVLSLVFGYVGMAGVVNFAVEGDLAAGFDFGAIKPVVLSGDWLFAWLFYFVVQVAVGIASIPGITAPFAAFYGLQVTGRAFGEAFGAAGDGEPPRPATDEAGAAV